MEEEEKSERPCCLSHVFFTEALRNPSKIAVVHASGASRICKESRARIHDPNFDDAELFDRCRESSSPPVYSGDECFTYADVLSSVDSLSSQIRHVLDGGDDPDVVRPKGYFHRKLTANNRISESPSSVGLTGQLENGSQCTCQPSASVSYSCNEGTSTETHEQSAGAGTPQVVGILIAPSVEYIVAVLSVLRCGEGFLPLDPYWPKERILSIVSSSKVGLLIKCTSSFGTSGSHLIESAEWLQDQSCSVLCMSIRRNCKEKVGRSNLPWPCENRNPRMFCYSMYTSGSTGKPKGVYGTEKGLLNRFLWMQALFPLHEGDILIFKTSVSFVDHLQEFLSAVLTCTPLIIPPFHVLKENPLYLVNFLKVYCVSRLTAVPSLMRVILPAMRGPHKMQIKESLRVLVLSGEVLPVSLWEILHKLLPETSILNLYGSTEAFCEALMVEGIADFDDFFVMGGNSIAAAHVAHKLGIDMRLLYIFSTPCQLLNALLDRKGSYENMFSFEPSREAFDNNMIDSDRMTNDIYSIKSHGSSMQMEFGEWAHNFTQKLDTGREGLLSKWDDDSPVSMKLLKTDASVCTTSCGSAWLSFFSLPAVSSFSRCNKVMYERELEVNNGHQECFSLEIPRNENKVMQEMWKVHLRSCVDASPLVVFKDGEVSLLIGSHSFVFLCINALSGLVRWEVKLEGRVECSAAITGDFSQVVVGCYKGKIYFLDFMSGSISWVFQTGGEVKSQPVVDKYKNVIWCGSHDHNLYCLDYKHHCCVYTVSCGGSIYGSPAIDLTCNKLYVASTSGRVTAISIEAIPFNVAWLCELGAPIFGSLSISSLNGNVICCLVDGHVVALDSSGSLVWKAITGGPIFAGPCISSALPSQVLVCCRNGSIYSFELEGGEILWEYQIGDPITSAAYVDENIQLRFDPSCPSDRLACICSCSGRIYVLRISQKTVRERSQCLETPTDQFVQKFASIDLPGDIFSSPVMIGGRIFIGCRDDNVHCIDVKFSSHL